MPRPALGILGRNEPSATNDESPEVEFTGAISIALAIAERQAHGTYLGCDR